MQKNLNNNKKIIKYIYYLSILVFLTLQTGLVSYSILFRDLPVELDDAFNNILKAAQMKYDFYQEGNALKSLKDQADNSLPFRKNEINQRFILPVYLIYHPLYSLLLLTLHEIGFEWETCFNLICIAGSIFIGVGIALLLKELWGLEASSIALLILSINIFPDHGIHYIVPSNIAFGTAVWMWWAIFKKYEKQSYILIFGIPVLCLLHKIGLAYAVLTILFYLIISKKEKRVNKTAVIASFLITTFLVIGLPYIITKPMLKENYFGNSFNMLDKVWENIKYCSNKMKNVGIMSYPIWSIGVISFFAIFLFSPPEKRQLTISSGIGFIVLSISSLFVVVNDYPAEAFSRLFIGWCVWYAGALGVCIISLIKVLYHFIILKPNWKCFDDPMKEFWDSKSFMEIKIGAIIISVFYIINYIGISSYVSLNQYVNASRNMVKRYNFTLDIEQPKKVLKLLKPDDEIYYEGDTIPLVFYLIHGFFNYNLVFSIFN